ncbi:hypothetical protein Taro_037719 [Colocasia esculenta]|uniref:Uncharacterized protein n=1 Tax=Colocasia esculenta TaxID=4460 RepID=A0A843WLJ6_COLES|nr:hypothetical protein [Colocasia esculenta]
MALALFSSVLFLSSVSSRRKLGSSNPFTVSRSGMSFPRIVLFGFGEVGRAAGDAVRWFGRAVAVLSLITSATARDEAGAKAGCAAWMGVLVTQQLLKKAREVGRTQTAEQKGDGPLLLRGNWSFAGGEGSSTDVSSRAPPFITGGLHGQLSNSPVSPTCSSLLFLLLVDPPLKRKNGKQRIPSACRSSCSLPRLVLLRTYYLCIVEKIKGKGRKTPDGAPHVAVETKASFLLGLAPYVEHRLLPAFRSPLLPFLRFPSVPKTYSGASTWPYLQFSPSFQACCSLRLPTVEIGAEKVAAAHGPASSGDLLPVNTSPPQPTIVISKSTLLMLEIQRKILTLRDILDLPPLNGAMMIELLMATVGDLQKFCPDSIPQRNYEIDKISMYQGLCLLHEALKFVGTTWAKKCKQSGKFHFEEVDLENISSEHLGERILQMLDLAAIQGREFLDLMEEEDQNDPITPQHQQGLGHSNMDNRTSHSCMSPRSPPSPTSVLPERMSGPLDLAELAKIPCSPPLLWPLRLQALGKLKPIDVKHLSFHAPPHQVTSSQQERGITTDNPSLSTVKTKNGPDAPLIGTLQPAPYNSPAGETSLTVQLAKPSSQEVTREMDASTDATPLSSQSELAPSLQSSETLLPQKSPLVPEEVHATPSAPKPPQRPVQMPCLKASPPLPLPPPPPPPDEGSEQLPRPAQEPQTKGSPPLPPPPPPAKGSEQSPIPRTPPSIPPPPPPAGVAKALRAKKSATKLKRSTHMGNLYRLLKGKVEGSVLNGQPSHGRRNQIGNGSGAKKGQGMDDALAEMTKRSAYFQQIEEDVKKYGPPILELKSAINSFQTSDMNELVKFHKHVELNLENLTDESQVLARFEGFPLKKLESIRMAATLYVKLQGVATNIQNWKMVASTASLLDKVESYFSKIKEEVDAIERSKEEDSKLFKSHNINFDFNILTRVKELMVDLSSSCMETVLKERRKERAARAGEVASKSNGHAKMLWRAFQLAFRVYNFAGGQDDRADKLTKEVADEIQTCPEN